MLINSQTSQGRVTELYPQEKTSRDELFLPCWNLDLLVHNLAQRKYWTTRGHIPVLSHWKWRSMPLPNVSLLPKQVCRLIYWYHCRLLDIFWMFFSDGSCYNLQRSISRTVLPHVLVSCSNVIMIIVTGATFKTSTRYLIWNITPVNCRFLGDVIIL